MQMADYTVLPLHLPETASFRESAIHYVYLRPHEPHIPDPDSSRALFALNLPIDTTELHIRYLFGSQLSSGRVEKVEFQHMHYSTKRKHEHGLAGVKTGAKRKRKLASADDLQGRLDSIHLPSTWDRQLHPSGSHAVIIFVDKASKEASLKAVKKANKRGTRITWGEGIDESKPSALLGVDRYAVHEQLRYPDRADLLRTVNDYMTVFSEVAEARGREQARKAQEPDEDGFVTITQGPKMNDVSRQEEVKELLEKQEKRDAGFGDFYRFQTREKRKERQNELLRSFAEDKKRLEEMRKRRGKIRVGCSPLVKVLNKKITDGHPHLAA